MVGDQTQVQAANHYICGKSQHQVLFPRSGWMGVTRLISHKVHIPQTHAGCLYTEDILGEHHIRSGCTLLCACWQIVPPDLSMSTSTSLSSACMVWGHLWKPSWTSLSWVPHGSMKALILAPANQRGKSGGLREKRVPTMALRSS